RLNRAAAALSATTSVPDAGPVVHGRSFSRARDAIARAAHGAHLRATFACCARSRRMQSTHRLGARLRAFRTEHAGERRTASRFADDFQPRLVQRQNVLDDRQPQSRDAGGARAAGGNAVEAFGQARDVLRRDAVAGVGNAEARAAAGLAFPSDSDAA